MGWHIKLFDQDKTTFQIERFEGLIGNYFLQVIDQVLPSGLGEWPICKGNSKVSGGEGTDGNGQEFGDVPADGKRGVKEEKLGFLGVDRGSRGRREVKQNGHERGRFFGSWEPH